MCVLLGPSGPGRSALLNRIGGLVSLNSGKITVDGQKITGLSRKRTAYRKRYHLASFPSPQGRAHRQDRGAQGRTRIKKGETK
ncbi:MAG: ATP-binding cassette domain-containing protein [Clostridia bacterium]|nr:ATP-binding cassette domain-containing protein [Clostridia bacterium]